MGMVEKIPCSKHGHPAWISSRLRAWIDFFQVIAPYCHDGRLDHVLISKICEEYGINFVTAFEKLTWIFEIVREIQGEDYGDKGI